ncbi:MAG: hypothetical protein KBC64_08110, partial [Simkaniaceae bacterium]|nr:hypothetical protein [Simkaniaceae bacterium]
MTIHNTDLSAVKGFIAQNPSNITGDIKTFLSSKKGKIITAVALTAITALLVTGALGVGHVGVLGHSFGASQALLGISISTILLTSIVALGIFLGQARINAWNDERRKKAVETLHTDTHQTFKDVGTI